MLTTSILLHQCSDHIIETVISQRTLPDVRSILLYHDQQDFSPYYLYIGTFEDISALFETKPQIRNLTFISSNGIKGLLPDYIPEQCNLIISDLDLITLYNMTSRTLDEYRTWNVKLEQSVNNNLNLDLLLKIGYEMIGVPMILINNYYKALAIYIPEECHDYILDEFQQNYFLCFDSIQSLHKNLIFEKQYSPYHREVILEHGKRYIISRIIRYKNNVIARLSLHLPDESPSRYLSDLSADLAHYVTSYLLQNFSDNYEHFNDIDALVADLIEQNITNRDEVEQRLALIPDVVIQRRYHMVLIQFHGKESKNMPWVFIKNQLSSVFPESNIAVYKDSIVLLAKKIHHTVHLEFNEEQLNSLLTLYDGYAVVGNYSKFLTSLHAVYFQTHSVFPLIQAFKKDNDQRIFSYEDYSIYHVISLCAKAFSHSNPQDQLIYLCHPALIAIFRHDKKYGTNLMEVLQKYLSNDRNSTQTAKDLFIHRNTLLYRLGKIEEIMGENLESQTLRERLTFSFHLIEYMDKVLHINPLF